MKAIALLIGILTSTTIFVAGCSSPPPAPPKTPPVVPYSTVWSTQSGVDLYARPAELIRASFEGARMAEWAGVDNSFPGFAAAVAHADPYSAYFGSTTQKPNDSTEPYGGRLNLQLIARLNASDTDISAMICTFRRRLPPKKLPAPGVDKSSFYVLARPRTFTIHLTRSPNGQVGQTGLSDRNPTEHDPRGHKVPTWNVFGDWHITSLKEVLDDVYNQPECVNWWPTVLPGWRTVPDYPYIEPPATATSRWSALAIPSLPPNYPEWIERTGDAA